MAHIDDDVRNAAPAPARGTDGVRYDLRLLLECGAILAARLPAAVVASRVVEAALAYLCDVCAIHAFDRNGDLSAVAIGDRRRSMQHETERAFEVAFAAREGIVRATARAKDPFVFGPEPRDGSPLASSARALLGSTGGRSLIVVPLAMGPDAFGTLTCVKRGRDEPFDLDDVELAVAVARQVGLGLENALLREHRRRTAERTALLARATDRLFETLDRTELLRYFLGTVTEEFADGAVAASLAADGLRIIAAAPAAAERLTLLDRFPDQGIFGEPAESQLIAAASRHGSLLVNDPLNAAGLLRASLSESLRPVAWMMAPLFVDGRSYGAVVCYSTSRRYEESDLESLQELCRRASLALEHAESFERERRLTQTLQQATLPSNLAVVPGAVVSAVYLPAAREERVGGDWYDAFPLEDGRILLTVGDVTGHGLEASIIMGKLRHALNVVGMYEDDPARILDMAERIVLRRYPNALATAFVAVLDPAERTITYANAGHPQPMLRMRDGSCRVVEARGLPIGLRGVREPGRSRQERIDEVALLVIYTDGLTESARNIIEGERRLGEALSREAILFVRDAAEFVRACCLDGPAPDDVAILALNFLNDLERWSFRSDDSRGARQVRNAFVQRLRERVSSDDDVHAAELVFGELAANVARHAPGPVDVVLEWQGPGAVLHMIDRGEGYPAVVRRRPADLYAESGRGLWLVDALAGALDIETIPRFGTHARVALNARG